MARVALIHPPGTDPRSPRLALPSLAGYLRTQGVAVHLLDLDLESFEAVVSRASLARAAHVVRANRLSGKSEAADADRLVALADRLPETAPEALGVFRAPEKFYDGYRRVAARETLLDALDLLSAACRRPVHYGLEPLRYDVDGVDPTRFADLERVTADQDANLFRDHWEAEVFPSLANGSFDLIGISIAVRFQLIPALMLARELRARGHFIVLGGSFLQRYGESLTRLPRFFELFADGAVVGDGETATLELLRQLEGRREFREVPNYLYLDDGNVRRTRTHLEDVASLPAPDFSGLPLDRYLVPHRVLPVLVGRGCYWGECKFCEIPHNNRISEQPYRFRLPEKVVEDVLGLATRFDCRHFVIGDEAVRPEAMEAIADGLAAAGREDLRFAAYIRFEQGFTPSRLKKLERMGLRRVLLGLESGWQPTNDHMRKGIRVSDVRPALQNLREAGISFALFALVGLPEESEQSARATFEYFERNADLFDAPGCSFDVRPFELLANSPYLKEADDLGLQFDADLLSNEFPIGVGQQWENSRGLTRTQIERLFEEYMPRISRIAARSRSGVGPVPLWPIWDEWALLYSDRYHRQPFPYRSTIPESGDARVELSWNPFLGVTRLENEVRLSSRRLTLVLDLQSFEAIGAVGKGSIGALMARLTVGNGKAAETRSLLNLLAAARLLEIRPADGGGSRPGEERRREETGASRA
jgi:radical SAM superfamily enzyme YgiQ (UPF0313 family)